MSALVLYATQQEKTKEDADCCDVVGQSVLTSEIDAWNVSYLADQVFGTPGVGEAQERRARALCKTGEKGDAFLHQRSCVSCRFSPVVYFQFLFCAVLCLHVNTGTHLDLPLGSHACLVYVVVGRCVACAQFWTTFAAASSVITRHCYLLPPPPRALSHTVVGPSSRFCRFDSVLLWLPCSCRFRPRVLVRSRGGLDDREGVCDVVGALDGGIRGHVAKRRCNRGLMKCNHSRGASNVAACARSIFPSFCFIPWALFRVPFTFPHG